MNIDLVLTDEFVAFSKKIEVIYNEKRKKKQELKAFYEKIQEELKALDERAEAAIQEFECWKKEMEKEDGPTESTDARVDR